LLIVRTFVRTNGDDDNDGLFNTSGGAFATLQHAVDVVAGLDLNGHVVSIQAANGTYTGAVELPALYDSKSSGYAVIVGNTISPSSVIVQAATVTVLSAAHATGQWRVGGVQLYNTRSSGPAQCLQVGDGSNVLFNGNMEMRLDSSSGVYMAVADGARFGVVYPSNIAFRGAAAVNGLLVSGGSWVDFQVGTLTFPNNTAFSNAFVSLSESQAHLFLDAFTGSPTGKRFDLKAGSIVTSLGSGLAALPGTIAGTTDGSCFWDGVAFDNSIPMSAVTGLTALVTGNLTAIAGLTSAGDKVPYFTGAGTAAVATMTAAARTLLAAVDAAAQRTALGLTDASIATLDTDTALTANSDTRVASQKAVRTFVNNAVTGLWSLKGGQDCSANPNYPAASKGFAYVVTGAGKIGGGSGAAVEVGDVFIALVDNAGGTQAAVGASWFVVEHNLMGALVAGNNLSELTNLATARSNLGLGTLATQSGTFSAVVLKANNLNDLADIPTARTNLGLGTLATQDGTFAWVRDLITANRTYYVRTDGNDSNTGLADNAGGAFLTVQGALNWLRNHVVHCGDAAVVITLQIANGTYAPFAVPVIEGLPTAANFVVQGNLATPASVNITTTGVQDTAVAVLSHARTTLRGFHANAIALASFNTALALGEDSEVILGISEITSTAGWGITTGSRSVLRTETVAPHMTVHGATLYSFMSVGDGSDVDLRINTLTLSDNPAVSNATILVGQSANSVFNYTTLVGSATGKRFDVGVGSHLDVLGGGANYVPGSTTGTVSDIAYYDSIGGLQYNGKLNYGFTSHSDGVVSTGTFTPDPALGLHQHLTNGGAFTLQAPTTDCVLVLQVLNNGSAGAITFAGFTVGSNTGDALDTTNAHLFRIRIERMNGVSSYTIQALQ
jgi:hypothetical protein